MSATFNLIGNLFFLSTLWLCGQIIAWVALCTSEHTNKVRQSISTVLEILIRSSGAVLKGLMLIRPEPEGGGGRELREVPEGDRWG